MTSILRITSAAGRPDEIEVTREAAVHGTELLRLGYTLSHVVHAYGAMCQSITELAIQKRAPITNSEFHDLNRYLDIAMAGAVTGFQFHRNEQETRRAPGNKESKSRSAASSRSKPISSFCTPLCRISFKTHLNICERAEKSRFGGF